MTEQDFGDEMVAYIAETLIALRDSLYLDGYPRAADLFADLTYRCDKYMEEWARPLLQVNQELPTSKET